MADLKLQKNLTARRNGGGFHLRQGCAGLRQAPEKAAEDSDEKAFAVEVMQRWPWMHWCVFSLDYTLQGTNISPKNAILKMIFLFPRWDMLIPWRVTQLMVIFGWTGFRRFGFPIGSPEMMQGLLLGDRPKIPNHRAPNHQFTISWITFCGSIQSGRFGRIKAGSSTVGVNDLVLEAGCYLFILPAFSFALPVTVHHQPCKSYMYLGIFAKKAGKGDSMDSVPGGGRFQCFLVLIFPVCSSFTNNNPLTHQSAGCSPIRFPTIFSGNTSEPWIHWSVGEIACHAILGWKPYAMWEIM